MGCFIINVDIGLGVIPALFQFKVGLGKNPEHGRYECAHKTQQQQYRFLGCKADISTNTSNKMVVIQQALMPGISPGPNRDQSSSQIIVFECLAKD